MGERNHTESNQQPITGILSNWAVVTFMHKGTILVDEYTQQHITLLLGDVDIDFKGRFLPGSWIKTSLVRHFDKTDFTVKTKYSCYQLNGDGYETTADIQFLPLFSDKGFKPKQIIEGFPHLIIENEPISASKTNLH